MSEADIRRLEARMSALEQQVDARLGAVEAKFVTHLEDHRTLEGDLREIKGGINTLKWLSTTVLPVGGVILLVLSRVL